MASPLGGEISREPMPYVLASCDIKQSEQVPAWRQKGRIRPLSYNSTGLRQYVEVFRSAVLEDRVWLIDDFKLGESESVYVFETLLTGQAIRIPKADYEDPVREVLTRVIALERGHGIANIEQLHGYSLIEPHVISSLMSGTKVDRAGIEEREAIPAAHFSRLVQTLIAMHERGLALDGDPTNVFLSESGINIIDYRYDLAKA